MIRVAQITLPRESWQAAHLEEGDYREAQVTEAGILLRPVSLGDRQPTPEQEADLAVVDEERKAQAAERRRGRTCTGQRAPVSRQPAGPSGRICRRKSLRAAFLDHLVGVGTTHALGRTIIRA